MNIQAKIAELQAKVEIQKIKAIALDVHTRFANVSREDFVPIEQGIAACAAELQKIADGSYDRPEPQISMPAGPLDDDQEEDIRVVPIGLSDYKVVETWPVMYEHGWNAAVRYLRSRMEEP